MNGLVATTVVFVFGSMAFAYDSFEAETNLPPDPVIIESSDSEMNACFEKAHPDAEQLHATASEVLYQGGPLRQDWDAFARIRGSLKANHARGAISDTEYTDLIHSWTNFETNYFRSQTNIPTGTPEHAATMHQVEVTQSLSASQSFLSAFYSQLSAVLDDRLKTCTSSCVGLGNEVRGDLSQWCRETRQSQTTALVRMAAEQRALAQGSAATSFFSGRSISSSSD